MAVFNSLGSNYRINTVVAAIKILLGMSGKVSDNDIITQLPFKKFTHSTFTYKGRHALSLALQSLGVKSGDRVVIQAFTCWAVEESIHQIGAVPVFADLAENALNFDLSILKKVYANEPGLKAIIVQHTFGVCLDLSSIHVWAQKNNIVIIEDLAHGMFCPNVGKYSNALALSFGRDKLIDAVSGGLVLSDRPIHKNLEKGSVILKDVLYPLITVLIRTLYPIYLGKVIHALAKKMNFLPSPIANSAPKPTLMTQEGKFLLKQQIDLWDEIYNHRKKISSLYAKSIPDKLRITSETSVYLRFPLRVQDPTALTKFLKKHSFYLSDRWFRSVVEKGNLQVKSSYKQGSCPNAEKVSAHVYNLPTHINLSHQKANELVTLIKKYGDAYEN